MAAVAGARDARVCRLVLAILPFEPAAHLRLGGPPCIYVGHPMIERVAEMRPNAEELKRRGSDPPIVLVLPGSRSSELQRLLATFGTAIARVAERTGPLELVCRRCHIFCRECVRALLDGRCSRASSAIRPKSGRHSARRGRRLQHGDGDARTGACRGTDRWGLSCFARRGAVARLMRSRELSTIILANLVVGENIVRNSCNAGVRPNGWRRPLSR